MINELMPPKRILMGPGPSDVHPHVLKSMATPLVGHLDPHFLKIMDETMDLLRQVYQTENKATMAMSGTGSAGMETVFVNLLEPGDKVIVGVNGLFGQRMVDVAERCGAEVIEVTAPWGSIIKPEDIEQTLKENTDIKLVALVHAETSTGVRQPLEDISRIVHEHDALLVCDMVTSLGGCPTEIDKMGVDAAYSGTQKCLSAPPGLAPVTLGSRAMEVMSRRKQKVQSWYLDLSMIQAYWSEDSERFYHHTAPISMLYALRESLRLIVNEGLENVYARHKSYGDALHAGLEAMGLKLLVEEQYRLSQLTSVVLPEGVDDGKVRSQLLKKYNLEIGGGLGDLKGKIWRIGLMGYNARQENVTYMLAALEDVLREEGFAFEEGAAMKAASQLINV
ncbi:alanine-glyoxylate transaminase/serine-glyoxylate transaminase/serine-pyruvate transaminase [Bacillus ectoiniformans]|uniref:pyridoxal-phosphate-dependent aminotransferase family protein n=1 Tax=Bacillus ectoiniformans TaxID=1494429 RepID=UPI0019574FFC|nr:alanine--glyoxylate aminotransferase family protein [Bacillus ectoiniformans]MBM7649200.1 alanine-glyoxylate transaminase/serine-glyoxylate transaminase/serine-pyruvate transaminase [Bacillus ectoiniformans]